MTLYAPSDIHSITVPDGCGSPHEAGDGWPGQRMTINCPACEAALGGNPHLGFATQEHAVKPTCDELAEQDRHEKAAAVAGNRRLAQWQVGGDGGGGTADALAVLVAQNAALLARVAELTKAAEPVKVAEPVKPAKAAAVKAAAGKPDPE
jgi:hypothetical protein